MKVTVIPIVMGALGVLLRGLVQRLADSEVRGQIVTPPKYSIMNISQNSEKGPGDLRRQAIIQTPVRNHQQTLV